MKALSFSFKFAAIVLLGSPFAVDATLIERGNGLIYDDALDVTWLQNANQGAGSAFDNGDSSTDGAMTWDSAVAWADGLVFSGFDDWRLPSMDVNSDNLVINCHPDDPELVCRDNELGHMFAKSLEIMPGNQDLIQNVDPNGDYWSSTLDAGSGFTLVWTNHAGGEFGSLDPNLHLYAWAVRDGDVLAVHEPATRLLLATGLAGLLGFRRKLLRQKCEGANWFCCILREREADSTSRVHHEHPIDAHARPPVPEGSHSHRRSYLNNIVEQDHRGVKRRLRPMLGLKTFATATATIADVELAHMLRKGQRPSTWSALSMPQRFTKLAA